MSRSKTSETKYVLIAWQDSDIPDLIKDVSCSGKLMPQNKESNNNENGCTENKKPEIIKKKRATKKSIFSSQENNPNLDDNSESLIPNSTSEPNSVPTANKLISHFSFGNQGLSTSEIVMNKTSNNKLDNSLRITYAEMCHLLKSYKPTLYNSIELLNKSFEEKYFHEWLKLMNSGFNILLHGVGSKKALIEKFVKCKLDDFHFIILLGYHHDLNGKNLMRTILQDVLELNESYKSIDEQINAINEHLKTPLYIIIHNIDGNCMRDNSIQFCLSELATNQYIHLIASVDHINSTLLWDNIQFVSFKWIHYEINTLNSYNDEIMFENSLMLNQSANVQLSSMIHILKSLTTNAKNIFLTMVEYVLNPENVKKCITFTKLYHECREKFYVSNELTLRAQLTEFIDHKMIKIKTESDGYETIYIQIDEKNLKLYLEELKDKI